MIRSAKCLFTFSAFILLCGTLVGAPIIPSSPTTSWTAIPYPTMAPDFLDDQQTGNNEGDIVGNDGFEPAFYTQFDDAGTSSLVDGSIAFRVRIGDDKNPPGYTNYFFVGIDANSDAALDLFLGVDGKNPPTIGIWDVGTDSNTSPNTTDIVGPLDSYSQTTANYGWDPVNATTDPTATNYDLNNDGTDYFLSFIIPFDDVVTRLGDKGITADENTIFNYVLGTSTQDNALNQDLGGPDDKDPATDFSQTWAQLGALSTGISANNMVVVPEPSSTGMLLAGCVSVLGFVLWRRRRSN